MANRKSIETGCIVGSASEWGCDFACFCSFLARDCCGGQSNKEQEHQVRPVILWRCPVQRMGNIEKTRIVREMMYESDMAVRSF